MPYSIRFSDEVHGHLRHLTARQRAREGFVAPWELRVGDIRVYYDVEVGAEGAGIVVIQAVGIKIRNRLFIEGREIKS